MDQIEEIGPLLGILSFVGLAVLVFLLTQQAREVRRLREWAGRAPERAILIAEREAEERGTEEPGRFDGLRAWLARAYASIDRISPVDPKVGLAFIVATVVALVVLVGFVGVFGGDDAGSGDGPEPPAFDRGAVRVAVLNGTATATSPAVPELAAKVARKVKQAGYALGDVTDGPSTSKSVAMFRRGQEEKAEQVAADLRKSLGAVKAVPMTDEIVGMADGADVALVIGLDDSRL